MTVYVEMCDEAAYIPASSTSTSYTASSCSAPYYAPQPNFIPPMDVYAGAAIGMAILATWAIAAGWRTIGRVFW